MGVGETALPHKRRAQQQFEVGIGDGWLSEFYCCGPLRCQHYEQWQIQGVFMVFVETPFMNLYMVILSAKLDWFPRFH